MNDAKIHWLLSPQQKVKLKLFLERLKSLKRDDDVYLLNWLLKIERGEKENFFQFFPDNNDVYDLLAKLIDSHGPLVRIMNRVNADLRQTIMIQQAGASERVRELKSQGTKKLMNQVIGEVWKIFEELIK